MLGPHHAKRLPIGLVQAVISVAILACADWPWYESLTDSRAEDFASTLVIRVLRPSAKEPRNNFQQIAQTYCDLQTKFVAKFVSPVPLYFADCG